MRLIAELTMPNRGSWSGGWSSEDKKNTVSINVGAKKVAEIIGHYSYGFGDGWRANVEIRKPKPRERATGRFCGYQLMIASIRIYGDIQYHKGLR